MFISILKQKIKKEIPFSFTRFGDGEIYILNNNCKSESIKNRFLKNWGFKSLSDYSVAVSIMSGILEESIINSDVIGLMDENYSLKNLKGFKYSKEIWSLSHNFFKKINVNPNNLKVANHQLPRCKELGDIYEFKKIINEKDLHIISPYCNELKNNNIDKILSSNVTYTYIPKSTTLNEFINLSDNLGEIKPKIVLYGCAAGGKILGARLKQKGKICLDFGATISAWAGICDRKWFMAGNSQHHCLIKS